MKRSTPLQAKRDGENMLGIPNIGDRRSKTWELIDEFFVDSSGFGQLSEPALTIKEFYAKVKAGLGYAVIEEGQFQVFIGVFKKIGAERC